MVEVYVNSYKNILEEKFGINITEARLITYDELTNSETFTCEELTNYCSNKYPWIFSTFFLSGSASSSNSVYEINVGVLLNSIHYSSENGVRPVIIISKDNF